MKRIALFAFLLSACTGTVYPYQSSQPQYASTTTTQTATNPDGSATSTTTETVTHEAYPTAQPAAYEAPPPNAPPPPSSEPPPPPPPSSGDAACTKKDTPAMCVSLHVMLDVGAIIKNNENSSCRDASKALNRYADGHARELETFMNLEATTPRGQLEKFQKRHGGEATMVIGAAMELDQRCAGDEKLDRALQRVGFHGMIGQ